MSTYGKFDIICVKDKAIMRPHQIGASILDYEFHENPVSIISVDVKKCPKCGIEVISGIANTGVRIDEPDFAVAVREALVREVQRGIPVFRVNQSGK